MCYMVLYVEEKCDKIFKSLPLKNALRSHITLMLYKCLMVIITIPTGMLTVMLYCHFYLQTQTH